MKTLQEHLHELILSRAFLEEALALDLMNLSALARHLQADLEARLRRPCSSGSIMMALRRLTPSLREAVVGRQREQIFRDLSVRSGLCEFTLPNNPTLIALLGNVLKALPTARRPFFTFTQGIEELTVITEQTYRAQVLEELRHPRPISSLDALSGITLRLFPQAVSVYGVHYRVLKQLALNRINLVEVVSTFRELTLILKEGDVPQAFTVLMPLSQQRL